VPILCYPAAMISLIDTEIAESCGGSRFLPVQHFEWALKQAAPGETIIYCIGDLATSSVGINGDAPLAMLAACVRDHCIKGEVLLTQRAHPHLPFAGGRAFEYCATKCIHPRWYDPWSGRRDIRTVKRVTAATRPASAKLWTAIDHGAGEPTRKRSSREHEDAALRPRRLPRSQSIARSAQMLR